MAVTNTLVYYNMAAIMVVKSFIVWVPEVVPQSLAVIASDAAKFFNLGNRQYHFYGRAL
jgi:hypothetical protein